MSTDTVINKVVSEFEKEMDIEECGLFIKLNKLYNITDKYIDASIIGEDYDNIIVSIIDVLEDKGLLATK